MLSLENGWRARGWSLFRLVFGAYLFVHFAGLLPVAAEVFSVDGMGTSTTSPLFGFVPSLLWVLPGAVGAQLMVGFGLLASVPFALGVRDRWAATGMLVVLAGLFAANPLIANPSLPHVGWLLLAHACIPSAPSLRAVLRGEGADWRLPPAIFAAGWAVMALAYGYSGWTKLGSMSWVDGTALEYVLRNPLARPTPVRDLLLAQPELLRLSTWFALVVELAAPLLVLFRSGRQGLWWALLALQLGLLVLVDFADLTFGMLLLQWWTYEPGVRPAFRSNGVSSGPHFVGVHP